METTTIDEQFIPDELPPYVFNGADLDKLDADLKLIKLGQLDVKLPEDTYDYDAHQWETPKGKLIGELFAAVDAGMEL